MRQRITHPLSPLFDHNSKVLILGTMPSPASRQRGFYYAHPQNRFWRLMFDILETPFSTDDGARRRLCLDNGIALWDVLQSCSIEGAADSTIKNAVPNDLTLITKSAEIKAVFTTGQTAGRLYRRLCRPQTGLEAVILPSPSGANCAMKYDELAARYRELLKWL